MSRWISAVVTAVFCMHSLGLAQDVSQVQQAVEEVASHGLAIARKEGKNALIARYREIMEKYPGAEANLRIGGIIANVSIWDLPERDEPSGMARAFDVCAQAIAGIVNSATSVDKETTPAASACTVKLHHPTPIEVTSATEQQLYSLAVRILESSNYNTALRNDLLKRSIHDLHGEYRRMAAGPFLVVSFQPVRVVSTVGGELEVAQIVIGLRSGDEALPLLSINSDGALVGHSKYSGTHCVQLQNLVQEILRSGAASDAASVTTGTMVALARRISAGDVGALDELTSTAAMLYRDIDHAKDEARSVANLRLMREAMNVLGEEAGKGNKAAFQALKQALVIEQLDSFVPDALGIAAAAGHVQALQILLHPKRWGILQSSAVFALQRAANKDIEPAVDYLVRVMDNPAERALWHGASRGLIGAAENGNLKARAALERYEALSREAF